MCFRPDDYAENSKPVALISQDLYQHIFGNSGMFPGREIHLGGEDVTVIGVMPQHFEIPARSDVWIPLRVNTDRLPRDTRFLWVAGRLKDGVSREQAQAEMNQTAARLEAMYPIANQGVGIAVRPIRDLFVQTSRQALMVVSLAVIGILLIACVNVANLLLSRGAFRQREYALRMVFGASLKRLSQQLISESIILGLSSCVVGLLICLWSVDFLVPSFFAVAPKFFTFEVDMFVCLFTLAGSMFAGFLSALAPIVQLKFTRVLDVLKEGGGGNVPEHQGRRRIRNILVVIEISLAFILIMGAGSNYRMYNALKAVDPGICTKNVYTMQFQLPESQYSTINQMVDFMKLVLLRIEMQSGIESCSMNQQIPFRARLGWEVEFTVKDQNRSQQIRNPHANYQTVSPNYFFTLGIPLLAGRSFEYRDNLYSEPVVIVSRNLAEKFWGSSGNALNKHIRLSGYDSEDPWIRIIGVAEIIRHRGLDRDTMMDIYVPCLQQPTHGMTILVKTSDDSQRWIESVQNAVSAVDSNTLLYNVMPMDQVLSKSLDEPRTFMVLSIISALIALILSSVGVFGTLMYTINKQYHEIGIRMAMGAQRKRILGRYAWMTGRLIAAGIVVGAMGSFGVISWVPYTFISTSSGLVSGYVVTSLIITLVSAAASVLPLKRALDVVPVEVLRYE
jgi:putative ABC transport system permease protein